MRWKVLLLAAMCASIAQAGETPSDAVHVAAEAQRQIANPVTRTWSRYLWNWEQRTDALDAVAVAINMISANEVTIRPEQVVLRVPDSDPPQYVPTTLIRLDVRQLAPGDADFIRFFGLWESLVVGEPHFYAGGEGTVDIENVTLCGREITVLNKRIFARHVTEHVQQDADYLVSSCASMVPILRLDYWLDKVMKTNNGGRYYDFIGVVPDKTKLEDYLIAHGASIEQVKKLRSDERVLIARSKITNKVRGTSFFRGSGVRSSNGTGAMFITDDIFDEDVDPLLDPFRTLVDFKPRAHEVIIERKNGWPECTIWNEQQVAVSVVPPNVAIDHRAPEPSTRQLVPALSCIGCHAEDQFWKPLVNDFKTYVGTDGFDVLGQIGQPDSARRIRGLYSGDPQNMLMIARDTLSDQCLRATDKDTCEGPFTAVAAICWDYRFRGVSPDRFAREIGFDSAEQLVELGPSNLTFEGVSVADPTIGMIQKGIEVERSRADIVYIDACMRAMPAILRHRAEAQQAPPEEIDE